jgi:hypothetical protein
MWVTITEKSSDHFSGVLENEPAYIRNLSAGARISFDITNIAQILIRKSDPRWSDLTKKAVVSNRVLETSRILFLYREGPNSPQDSGWVVFAGGEDDTYSENSDNFQLLTLDRLLAMDENLQTVLNAKIGSAFERESTANEFRQIPNWKPPE